MTACARFVIVGASLAGLRAAEALRDTGYKGEIAIVGAEAHLPYNRPPLSKQILFGLQEVDDLSFPIAEDLDAAWHLGSAATGLDLADCKVTLANGDTLGYDRLLIATGVTPFVPPLPNINLPGVHILRTIDDACALSNEMQPGSKIAIVGAGFIGCEVAASARKRGLHVTVLDQMNRPMARVLPPSLSQIFRNAHEEEGVAFRFDVTVNALEGTDHVTGVTLNTGETIQADIVLVAIGSRPATGWLEGSGLILDNGVVCDQSCRALNGDNRIAAAGDVAVWPHLHYGAENIRIEHWTNAADQGAAAALALLHDCDAPYVPLPSFWSDQFALKLQSLGRPSDADRIEVVAGSMADRKFVAECWKEDQMVGVIALNMAPKLARYRIRMEQELQALFALPTDAAE
ncbi:FAD-dependent oxidoreductase [Rhodobacteraceae bacterium KMM 6894]|nr:FAD-dependent oxidoreductase [Rhodobacteraceae bacterium KMM 6894]